MAPQPTSGAETDIQRPLMLVMPVAIARLDELKTELQILEDPKANALLTGALDKVGLVHFTRFVLLEDVAQGWAKLIVDAIFDGPVPAYIAAFARELNWIFNRLFPFIEDHPTLPVEKHVDEFVTYVEQHDVRPIGEQRYSAYPGFTALDIDTTVSPHDQRASGLPAQANRTPAGGPSLDLDDIQGLVVRGYRMDGWWRAR